MADLTTVNSWTENTAPDMSPRNDPNQKAMEETLKQHDAVFDLPPAAICKRSQKLREEGYKVKIGKHTKAGLKDKFLHTDFALTRIFYAPSAKPQIEIGIQIRNLKTMQQEQGNTLYLESTDGKNMHIEFSSAEEREEVISVIAFARNRVAATSEDPLRFRLMQFWITADQNGDGKLCLDELISIAKKLHVILPPARIAEMMKAADKDNSGFLDFGEFKSFIEALTRFDNLRPLFDRYIESDPKSYMKVKEFQRFMAEVQGENLVPKVASKIIKANTAEPGPGFTMYYFSMFLLNPDYNGWQQPKDLLDKGLNFNEPLCNYHIRSSYNSILTGPQRDGKSSVEAVVSALESGCRCLDFNVYDGVADEPIICGGIGTNTTKISFQAVLAAVKTHAFDKTDLPLILIINNFCSENQQNALTQYIRTTFGASLATGNTVLQTTLNLLRKKVIVISNMEGVDFTRKQSFGEPHPEVPASKSWSTCVSLPLGVVGQENAAVFLPEPEASSNTDEELRAKASKSLLIVTPDVSKRVDSTNLSPIEFFSKGCQIVAMNMQKHDEGYSIMKAYFSQNGGAGFVPKIARPLIGLFVVRVYVLLAYHVPVPVNENLKLSVEIKLLSREGIQTKETTSVIGNAYNPCFNEVLEISSTSISHSILQLSVFNENSKGEKVCAGVNSLPVISLRMGYRAVALLDPTHFHTLSMTSVLCHFALRGGQ